MVTRPKMQIAGSIDAYRKSAGITLEELSLATDIPRTTLMRKLRNGDSFTVEELGRVSDFLDVPVASWLVAS